MEAWLKRQWNSLTCWQLLLWPVSLLFGALVALRRQLYRLGLLSSWRAPVPVVVVGNISVGGTGKTPLTLWLAGFLRDHGYHPGIVSRGYGGQAANVQAVRSDSRAGEVGDEPLLLARRSGCPVWVGRDRPAAARALLAAHPECDVLLCDDGLQHYALARDLEIAVGGWRSLGNGRLLPAGPLRETPARLRQVDLIVSRDGEAEAGEHVQQLVPGALRSLHDPARTVPPRELPAAGLHAVAGIGQPQRFFDSLRQLGLEFTPHIFPDHHAYGPADLQFASAAAVLMTEKDAVKCSEFARPDWWYLEVEARLDEAFGVRVLQLLRS